MIKFGLVLIVFVGFSCSQVQEREIKGTEDVNAVNGQYNSSEELYEMTINGSLFVMDTLNNIVTVNYLDDIENPYIIDTIDKSYTYLSFDTCDINKDGIMDVKFDFFDPGYNYQAWYLSDESPYYFSSYGWHIENPVFIDSAEMIFYTQELIGMDGSYVSALIQYTNVPVCYGQIHCEIGANGEVSWEGGIGFDKNKALDFGDFEDVEGFWIKNYLSFIMK